MLRNVSMYFAGATALVLGLSAGAMWAEAVVLVDAWRSVPAVDFLAWYDLHHAKLVAFYSPLQISATLLAVSLPIVLRLDQGRWSLPAIAASLFGLAVIALFFIFFKSANAEFLSDDPNLAARIPELLETWGRWQWLRTAIGVSAAVSAIAAVAERSCAS